MDGSSSNEVKNSSKEDSDEEAVERTDSEPWILIVLLDVLSTKQD